MTRDQTYFRMAVDQRAKEILRQHSGPTIMTYRAAQRQAHSEVSEEDAERLRSEVQEIRAIFAKRRAQRRAERG